MWWHEKSMLYKVRQDPIHAIHPIHLIHPTSHLKPTLIFLRSINEEMSCRQGKDNFTCCSYHLWWVISNKAGYIGGIKVDTRMMRNHHWNTQPPKERYHEQSAGREVKELDDMWSELQECQEEMWRWKSNPHWTKLRPMETKENAKKWTNL